MPVLVCAADSVLHSHGEQTDIMVPSFLWPLVIHLVRFSYSQRLQVYELVQFRMCLASHSSPECITIKEIFVTLPRHSKKSEIWIKQRLSLSAFRKVS